MGQRIGYGRVSTRDQSPDSQHDALRAAGCEKIFVDKASGKLARRPRLDEALAYARAGDVIVVTRLSRLARSLKNLLELTETLREREIDLQVLHQDIDTTTSTGRLVFHVLAAVDQFQRELIVEGTREGLSAARARGRTGGRPAALTGLQAVQARRMYDERGADGKRAYTVRQIADTFGVGRATIYRYLDNDTAAPPAGHRPQPRAGAKVQGPAPAPAPSPADAAEQAEPETNAEPEPGGDRQEREWAEQAERERAEFQARLKPVPEIGEGYLMAEWPGTGRYHLVLDGERIGHAVKKAWTSQWEAHSANGPKIPHTGTYKTRRQALIEVALHHRHTSRT